MDNSRAFRGYDQWKTTDSRDRYDEEEGMIQSGTEVRCPACEERFTLDEDLYNGEGIECDDCGEDLILVGGVLQSVDDEEDIYEEDDDSEEDEEEEDEEFEDEDEADGAKEI